MFMQHVTTKWSKERLTVLAAFFFILLYVSPLFLLGEDAHIRVHDNLDSNLSWYKVLIRSSELFGPLDAVIPQVINGLPRGAYGTEFSGIVWLHALFPSMTAYAISQTITRVTAFLGMYWLLKKHFIKEQDASFIRVGVSLAFALTPFWPSGMLSTLGQPLALWAFMNIRNREFSWKEGAILLLLPLYSSFVLGFFFFLTAMGLLWLRDVMKKRDWNPTFIGSIVLMTILYLVIEYRLVYALIFPEAPTNRLEFSSSRLELGHTIYLSFKNFFIGHTHVMTLHTLIILPILFLALSVVVFSKSQQAHKRFLVLLGLNFILSVWYAFWFYKGWQPLKEHFTLLNTFNFARFHFLRPLVIYLNFALGLSILWKLGKKWHRWLRLCLALQVLLLCIGNEEISYRVYGSPSFKQFYAVNLFKQIEEYIGQPQESYRVGSIGLHPAIAQYNGFYTLDTYNNFYPLAYKHQFRTIIAKELDKNHKLKTYFDKWGGRCYLFVSELGKKYDYEKDSTKKIHHLEFNMDAFRAMGGRYIFSSVPILNADEDELLLLNTFDNPESAWKIYLYKVKMIR
jgi:hypothetical protein